METTQETATKVMQIADTPDNRVALIISTACKFVADLDLDIITEADSLQDLAEDLAPHVNEFYPLGDMSWADIQLMQQALLMHFPR